MMKQPCLAAVLAFFIASCGNVAAESTTPVTPPPAPAPGPVVTPDGLELVGELRPTFYWVAMERADGAPKNHSLLDLAGNLIAKVGQPFWSEIRLEGTGKLLDGRVLNYHGVVDTADGRREVRYIVCPPDAPYGYGFELQYKLVPFRSVAVDPNVIPMGTTLYIPAAKGALLPDGSVHDGFFSAVDVGQAIQNMRIDVFTGYGDQSEVFQKVGFVGGRDKRYPVYRVRSNVAPR